MSNDDVAHELAQMAAQLRDMALRIEGGEATAEDAHTLREWSTFALDLADYLDPQ